MGASDFQLRVVEAPIDVLATEDDFIGAEVGHSMVTECSFSAKHELLEYLGLD
jgi:hypothetical protein